MIVQCDACGLYAPHYEEASILFRVMLSAPGSLSYASSLKLADRIRSDRVSLRAKLPPSTPMPERLCVRCVRKLAERARARTGAPVSG